MQEPDTALVLIQHALTPVFLIVGIGTLLNSLTARLSRIVDRVRWFDSPEAENFQTQEYKINKRYALPMVTAVFEDGIVFSKGRFW